MNVFLKFYLFFLILPAFESWEFPREEEEKVISEKRVPILKPRNAQLEKRICNGSGAFYQGVCMDIKQCAPVMDELKRIPDNKNFQKYVRYLWEICGKTGKYDVCCQIENPKETLFPKYSDQVPTQLPTPEEGCGYTSTTFKKIVGGEPSKVGAWPWLALIGDKNSVSNSPFICQGTIITARHILTAAHCLSRGVPFVRIGEHDLTRDDEAKHEDINVTRFVKHPNYNRKSGRNDIALLYLERNIVFSELISPICLPLTPELRSKSYINYAPFIAGWGKTSEKGETSSILLELKILTYDNEICKQKFRKRNLFRTKDQFDSGVICAGDLNGGKDSCFGDSGGPLMVPEDYKAYARFYLIGIVAYSDGCGRVDVPSVYTSTQYFMDWIMEKLAAGI